MNKCKLCGKYHHDMGYDLSPERCTELVDIELKWKKREISYEELIKLMVDFAVRDCYN